MAYNTITDTEIEPGKPGSNSLFTRLRDNAIAMITGLAGAPKILDAAFNTNSINANKLVNDSITATQIAANAVGSSEIAASAVGQNEIAASGVSSSELDIIQTRWLNISLALNATYTFPKGVHFIQSDAQIQLQYWNGSAWVILTTTTGWITIYSSGSNGSNWRLFNP